MSSTFEILPPKVGSWPYPGQGWKGFPASLASLPVPWRKGFIAMTPGANVIKPFTVVIYHYSMVLLSSVVIKTYYCSKYHSMEVNKPGKKFYNIGPKWQT
jgi:hypothetical protein